ncbi:FMN-binding negative transcriptional regulator [Mucilaginibacter ginkgonis]|uniref:FMN-binding negative transcriptional regulator n=1 Tax=Mucilaginibacter ginkgonis TaxID=2682091 RepID=A0A7T7FD52_9SPHI|nr:FMN-binding negative transcriptional regulator [Mucilaginibacter ginkgonis]
MANPQSRLLINQKVLAIFNEPHAYISPSHYEKELVVPTWNYIAVHAYGQVSIIDEVDSKLTMLKEMITFYNDIDYLKKWITMPLDYKIKMAKGIVAFEIIVDDLQAKMKLSQNKAETEKDRIIETLSSKDSAQQQVAEYMRRQQENGA